MTTTYFFKDKLPNPKAYALITLEPPLQSKTTRAPFNIMTNQQNYTLTPQFNYDLTGVVISYSNADGFTNIWHHDLWKDFINIRDLCVIWNPNVRSGVYQKMIFDSDSWTCWVTYNRGDAFNMTALSNNHLLTDNPQIKSALLKAEIGDVVHFKGVLTTYKNNGTGGSRGTSIRRDDTGQGACETVYIDQFDIVKKANPILRKSYLLSKWIAILSLIGYLTLLAVTPFKAR